MGTTYVQVYIYICVCVFLHVCSLQTTAEAQSQPKRFAALQKAATNFHTFKFGIMLIRSMPTVAH